MNQITSMDVQTDGMMSIIILIYCSWLFNLHDFFKKLPSRENSPSQLKTKTVAVVLYWVEWAPEWGRSAFISSGKVGQTHCSKITF